MDATDKKILDIIQKSARVKRSVIAEAVGLSLPSLSDRLNKLDENNIIQGYYAKLNRNEFGYDLMSFINVYMQSSKKFEELSEHVKETPEILECYAVLGEGSHMLKVIAKDTSHLEDLLAKIQAWDGVLRTVTSFVLSTIKETTTIKI